MSRIPDRRETQCEWVQDRLAALAAGELPAREDEACRFHLETCEDCAQGLRELELALGALRSVEEAEPPARAVEELLWRIHALPSPARNLAWRGIAAWSAAAAMVIGGVIIVLVLQRGAPLPTYAPAPTAVTATSGLAKKAQGTASGTATSAPATMGAQKPGAAGPRAAAPQAGAAPETGRGPELGGAQAVGPAGQAASASPGGAAVAGSASTETSATTGGRSSQRPGAQELRPSPARRVAPRPESASAAKRSGAGEAGARAGGGRAGSEMGRTGAAPAARRFDAMRAGAAAPKALRAPAGASAPAAPAASFGAAAENASSGRGGSALLARPQVTGKAGPGARAGAASRTKAYGTTAVEAAPFVDRTRVLGGSPGAEGLAAATISSISEPYWVLRVEAPKVLDAGTAAQLSLTIDGRESLLAVRARVLDAKGKPLGAEIDLPAVAEGRRVRASLPLTVPAAGHTTLLVSVQSDQPQVSTRVPVTVDVRKPAAPRPATISLVLRDVPLSEAAAAIGVRGKVKVTVAPALAGLLVDCNFADPVGVEAALRVLTYQVGGRLTRSADGAYHILEAGADGKP